MTPGQLTLKPFGLSALDCLRWSSTTSSIDSTAVSHATEATLSRPHTSRVWRLGSEPIVGRTGSCYVCCTIPIETQDGSDVEPFNLRPRSGGKSVCSYAAVLLTLSKRLSNEGLSTLHYRLGRWREGRERSGGLNLQDGYQPNGSPLPWTHHTANAIF